MSALLVFGFLMGVQHALEADHVAAVASLTSRSSSWADNVRLATVWGAGHAISLIVLGAILVVLDVSLPATVSRAFELAVGVILMLLGVDVFRRLRQRRIHFHVHQHAGGERHIHAHAHHEAFDHAASRHQHEHLPPRAFPRALAVGGLHGLAGSGALVLISIQTLGAGLAALGYVIVFALGSILGMVVFSLIISLPLRFCARHLDQAAGGLEATMGVLTITLGCWIVAQAAGL